MASAPPSSPRPWWHDFAPAITIAAMLAGGAFFYGGVTQRLTEVESQAHDLRIRVDQQDKDKEATIEKLSAIDGRTIRIETTLSLLKPDKDKAP